MRHASVAVEGARVWRPRAEVEAFHLVQRFRIQQQLLTRDRDRVNRVDPSDLNELHRLMLKEAFKQAGKLQLRLRQECLT